MAIEIIDTLSQKNGGSFPLVDSNDIRGGFYQVNTIEERDLIPKIRRKEGMLCAVKNDSIYQLVNGIENEFWQKFNSGGQLDSEDIELLQNGKIDDVSISTYNGITTMNLFANGTLLKSIKINLGGSNLIHVGTDIPDSDICEVWIDVDDDEEYTNKIEDSIIIEFRSIMENLQNERQSLKNVILSQEARITYLELNSGGCDCSGGHGGTQYKPLISEDGDKLILEDGTILTFEDLINNI